MQYHCSSDEHVEVDTDYFIDFPTFMDLRIVRVRRCVYRVCNSSYEYPISLRGISVNTGIPVYAHSQQGVPLGYVHYTFVET